jgi:hypothetical protein
MAATQTVKNATCLTIAYTRENSAIHFSTDERNELTFSSQKNTSQAAREGSRRRIKYLYYLLWLILPKHDPDYKIYNDERSDKAF